MKIAVCESDINEADKVSQYIIRFFKGHMIEIELVKFKNGKELVDSFNKVNFQIVFLSVNLIDISGIDIAFKIRERYEDCLIIFITLNLDYMFDGYEVGAVHYLVKPIKYEGVSKALNRCKHIFHVNGKYVNLKINKDIIKVHLKNIMYIEVYGKTVTVHTVLGYNLRTYSSLSEIATYLDSSCFINCNRSYIVNMNYIKEVLKNDFLLQNNEKIPIRKNGRQKVKEEYIAFMFNNEHNYECM